MSLHSYRHGILSSSSSLSANHQTPSLNLKFSWESNYLAVVSGELRTNRETPSTIKLESASESIAQTPKTLEPTRLLLLGNTPYIESQSGVVIKLVSPDELNTEETKVQEADETESTEAIKFTPNPTYVEEIMGEIENGHRSDLCSPFTATEGSGQRFVSPRSPIHASINSDKESLNNSSPDSVAGLPRHEFYGKNSTGQQLLGGEDSKLDESEFSESEFQEACMSLRETAKRKIRFADESGLPLMQVHVVQLLEAATQRIVVLLLSPQERTFEFIHAEYSRDDSTTVQVLLEQLPGLATNPVFQNKHFTVLSRTKTNEQFEHDRPLQDCELDESELVLGVIEGDKVSEIAAFAVPLLLNGKIIRAVNHAKRTGRGLKTVRSGNNPTLETKPDEVEVTAVLDKKSGNNFTHQVTTVLDVETVEPKQPQHHDSSKPMQGSETSSVPHFHVKMENYVEHSPELKVVAADEGMEDVPEMQQFDLARIQSVADNVAVDILDAVHCGDSFDDDDYFAEPGNTNELQLTSSDEESIESDVPDLDNIDKQAQWKYPDVRDMMGGDEVAEKVVMFMHTAAIAAVGIFATMG